MSRKGAPTEVPIPPAPFYFDGQTPTWEVAYLFPPQGRWTEDDFWALGSVYEGVPRVELSQGRLEVLPVPTQTHQLILFFLAKLLDAFAQSGAPGMVLPSGTDVRLKKGVIRQPDVVYMKAENARRRHEKYWDGADLVMEVVSPDPKDRERDLETKPREYARAGIPEYWIIDPQEKVIRVLTLVGKAYKVHGEFGPGTRATSVLLPGFAVAVDEALVPPGSEPAG
jgi:Uma2 family endonuclease